MEKNPNNLPMVIDKIDKDKKHRFSVRIDGLCEFEDFPFNNDKLNDDEMMRAIVDIASKNLLKSKRGQNMLSSLRSTDSGINVVVRDNIKNREIQFICKYKIDYNCSIIQEGNDANPQETNTCNLFQSK
jgi:hypothetical protein